MGITKVPVVGATRKEAMKPMVARWRKLVQKMDESLLMEPKQKAEFFNEFAKLMSFMMFQFNTDQESSGFELVWDMYQEVAHHAEYLEHEVFGCLSWKLCGWSGDESDFKYDLCKECQSEVLKP